MTGVLSYNSSNIIVFRMSDWINLFAGVCLVLAFICSGSLIQVHANIHRSAPQNQDLWMRSCGNCVDVSSNFPRSDSGNKSSMSNILKFS